MDDTDKLIREDQERHPNCSYSISNRKSCKTKDGSLVCEMMKSISRNCPSERPVNIYSSNTKFDEKAHPGMNEESFSLNFGLSKEWNWGVPNGGNKSINRGHDKELPRNDDQNLNGFSSSIEFRFGNDSFSEGSLFNSLFESFGIGTSEKKEPTMTTDKTKPDPAGPKVPPGTKVGPPEDI